MKKKTPIRKPDTSRKLTKLARDRELSLVTLESKGDWHYRELLEVLRNEQQHGRRTKRSKRR